MPPRYSYWTIIVDGGPTAFRAADRSELAPTLKQLEKKDRIVELKWFARGRLWTSPEEARQDLEATRARHRRARHPSGERRGPEWRPGGKHLDPRAKYDRRRRPERPPLDEQHTRPPRERERLPTTDRVQHRGEARPAGPASRAPGSKPWSKERSGGQKRRPPERLAKGAKPWSRDQPGGKEKPSRPPGAPGSHRPPRERKEEQRGFGDRQRTVKDWTRQDRQAKGRGRKG